MTKKVVILILLTVLLYAVVNHKFLTAILYLQDSNLANDRKAVKLLEEAVTKNRDSKSAFLLGYYYKTDKYKAIDLHKSHKYYMIASNLGDNEAKMLVAWNLYKGIGCTKNLNKSKSLLTQLAIAGNSKAKEILKFVIMH